MLVLSAYLFLCSNFQEAGPDMIFLIGFSRGAYAMRCLADLVSKKGLLPKSRLHEVHALLRDWNRCVTVVPSGREARITACALWDTVSSLAHMPFSKRWYWFVQSDVTHCAENNFQALALHEHRRAFFPIVMRLPEQDGENKHLEQMWFAGYHTDTGGGNENDALSHLPLIWIMGKLQQWIAFDREMLLDENLLPLTAWKVDPSAKSCKSRAMIASRRTLRLTYTSPPRKGSDEELERLDGIGFTTPVPHDILLE